MKLILMENRAETSCRISQNLTNSPLTLSVPRIGSSQKFNKILRRVSGTEVIHRSTKIAEKFKDIRWFEVNTFIYSTMHTMYRKLISTQKKSFHSDEVFMVKIETVSLGVHTESSLTTRTVVNTSIVVFLRATKSTSSSIANDGKMRFVLIRYAERDFSS